MITSVLLAFNLRQLQSIQLLTLLTHELKAAPTLLSGFAKDTTIWISSAYEAREKPAFLIIGAGGVTERLNRVWLSSEPWGTPQGREKDLETNWPIFTLFCLFARKDSKRSKAVPSIPSL